MAYALSGDLVTAQKAFVITAYYNILRQTMTVFFPQGIGQLAETLVSIRRIQNFMLYDEMVQSEEQLPHSATTTTDLGNGSVTPVPDVVNLKYIDSTESLHAAVNPKTSEPAIITTNLTARWDDNHPENTLDNITIQVQPGTLTAVIGPVGAGKSSLIQTIIGELPLASGDIKVNGDVSFGSQEPWLFSATVRQNILFGMPMNKARYREVVRRCALEKDFTLLANGDKTVVGERGQSLSGGQKARISLARACYRDATIYLLDDPLSAVDTHVGRHLFDQCLRNFLRNKTVILVTHQLQYLQNADQIIILDKGKVLDVGTYDSLHESGLDFAKMLRDAGDDEEEDDSGDELETSRLSRSSSKSSTKRRSRRKSDSSVESLENTQKAGNRGATEEARKEGTISWDVYARYFRASGGFCALFWLIVFCVTTQLCASGGDYFLTYWVNKEEARFTEEHPPQNETDSGGLFNQFVQLYDASGANQYVDIYIFTALTVATVVITLSRSFLFFTVS